MSYVFIMLCVCVCVQVLYGLEEEGKEKSDDSRPLLGDNVPTSERAFWDIFGGSKLQNRGQCQCQCVANRHCLASIPGRLNKAAWYTLYAHACTLPQKGGNPCICGYCQ